MMYSISEMVACIDLVLFYFVFYAQSLFPPLVIPIRLHEKKKVYGDYSFSRKSLSAEKVWHALWIFLGGFLFTSSEGPSEDTHECREKNPEKGCGRADLFPAQWVGVLCLGEVGTTPNFEPDPRGCLSVSWDRLVQSLRAASSLGGGRAKVTGWPVKLLVWDWHGRRQFMWYMLHREVGMHLSEWLVSGLISLITLAGSGSSRLMLPDFFSSNLAFSCKWTLVINISTVSCYWGSTKRLC